MTRKPSAFTIIILIIGVVIAGIITADHMISKARIAAAQNLTKSSPITSYSDTIFWLESSMPTSFEASEANDGMSLSTWKDNANSDAKNNAVAGTSSPTYANTINRIHASKFSGGQHFVINGSSLNNTYYSIVVVDKRLSGSSNNYFIGDPAVNTDNQSLLLGYSENGKIMHSQGATKSYTANIDTYEDSSGSPRIIVFTSSAAGKKMYINGVLVATSTDATRLTNIGDLVIGKSYNGEIGEVAAFSHALTDAERSDIETYLAKKYEVKKFSGTCINGTMKISGCSAASCSISATGISATVNAGSSSVACNQTGYSGTVSYDCTDGVGSVSGSCSCASGYASSGGSCVRSCVVNVTGSSTTSTTAGGSAISCNQTGYTGTVSNSCNSLGTTVTGTCSCDTGYTLSSGVCSPITCSITAGSGFAAKTNLGYTASAATISSPCQTGFAASSPAPTYTCKSSGAASVSGACSAITCSVSSGTGYNSQSGLVYAESGSGTFNCDATGYTGTKSYTCTSTGTATITGGACSCDTGYALSSGVCSPITCSIAAANGFAAKTGLAYAASATTILSPCQYGYTASSPAPTYTCTSSGTVTPTGSCTAITCSIAAANGFAAQTGLAYAASATTISNPCQYGYTASSPAPTYTCTSSGTVTPTGSCGRYVWVYSRYVSNTRICNGGNSATLPCNSSYVGSYAFLSGQSNGGYNNATSLFGYGPCYYSNCFCSGSYWTYQSGDVYRCTFQ